MTQYIVFRHQDEVPVGGNMQAYYEASIVGYYLGERGKKKRHIKAVAAFLSVPPDHITLVKTLVSGDTRTAIALRKGDILQQNKTE